MFGALPPPAEGKALEQGAVVDLAVAPWAHDIDNEATQFVRGKRVSGGAMGAVFEATLRGQAVAAKTHHAFLQPELYGLNDNPENFRGVLREVTAEIAALARLNHPVAGQRAMWVGFHGVVYKRTMLAGAEVLVPNYLLMDLVRGPNTLEDIIVGLRDGGQAAAASFVRRIVVEVAEGLQALHKQGCMHRDIKPANVLVGPDSRMCIADLGLATLVQMTMQRTQCGTPAYQAPEIIRTGVYNAKVDIYALGVVAIELILLEQPSQAWDMRSEQLQRAVTRMPELEPLLRGCMHDSPAQRWSAEQVVAFVQAAHPMPAAAATVALQMQVEALREQALVAERDAKEQRARARAEKQRAQQAEQENQRLKEEIQRLRRALQQATEAKRGMEAQRRREQEAAARQVH